MPRTKLTATAALTATILLTVACGGSNGTSSSDHSAAEVAGTLLADSAAGPSHADSLMARADSARIQGSPTAPLWIIEVSDFQCPYCRDFHAKTYPAVLKEYVQTGKARLAYVNFPIPSAHPNAVPAALSAMCAAAQDKFWPMHDKLFNEQDRWAPLSDPTPVLDSLASSVGVNMQAFDACLSSKVMQPLVDADRDRAENRGVRATPTFLIGGQKIEGAQEIDVFRRVIDSELAKASASGR